MSEIRSEWIQWTKTVLLDVKINFSVISSLSHQLFQDIYVSNQDLDFENLQTCLNSRKFLIILKYLLTSHLFQQL